MAAGFTRRVVRHDHAIELFFDVAAVDICNNSFRCCCYCMCTVSANLQREAAPAHNQSVAALCSTDAMKTMIGLKKKQIHAATNDNEQHITTHQQSTKHTMITNHTTHSQRTTTATISTTTTTTTTATTSNRTRNPHTTNTHANVVVEAALRTWRAPCSVPSFVWRVGASGVGPLSLPLPYLVS